MQTLRRSSIDRKVIGDVWVLLTGGHASLSDIVNVKIIGTGWLTGASCINCKIIGGTSGHAVESSIISV